MANAPLSSAQASPPPSHTPERAGETPGAGTLRTSTALEGSALSVRQLDQIQPGWDIIGTDGEKIGDVDEVHPHWNVIFAKQGIFFPKDLYIPASAVTGVERDTVYVNTTKDQAEARGWDKKPEIAH